MVDTCMFCGHSVKDQGLGFYEHVEAVSTCRYLWTTWMERIPADHGGA
ncbi:MAG: hypothetical protein R3185_07735 [Candidatus Thermoplasmatota archaeon]|nr:hypothetical protein [Candidatus Thermoplasmatota archaeon]